MLLFTNCREGVSSRKLSFHHQPYGVFVGAVSVDVVSVGAGFTGVVSVVVVSAGAVVSTGAGFTGPPGSTTGAGFTGGVWVGSDALCTGAVVLLPAGKYDLFRQP